MADQNDRIGLYHEIRNYIEDRMELKKGHPAITIPSVAVVVEFMKTHGLQSVDIRTTA